MMRLLAALTTVAMLAAAVWSGWSLWQVMAAPRAVPAAPPASVTIAAPVRSEPRVPGRVPAIFGQPLPPERPQPGPVPDPSAGAPPVPPLSSLGYRLNGIVQVDGATWATLSHPAGERLVQVGDPLAPGVVATRIDADGLWVSRSGRAPELLGFPD